jgi:AcrR family transcriptional regulator
MCRRAGEGPAGPVARADGLIEQEVTHLWYLDRVAPSTSSREKILEGAIRAFGRFGLRKFSMSDVSDEAGVSRGTLYRYFKSKDQVLEAVGEYVEGSLRATLTEAVTASPEPEKRLEIVLQALLDYGRAHAELVRIVEAEPSAVLRLLSREFPALLGAVADALGPVLSEAQPVRDGTLTKRQLAEMFTRLVLSVYLVPSPGSDQLAKRVAALWKSMTAAPAASSRRSTIRTAS